MVSCVRSLRVVVSDNGLPGVCLRRRGGDQNAFVTEESGSATAPQWNDSGPSPSFSFFSFFFLSHHSSSPLVVCFADRRSRSPSHGMPTAKGHRACDDYFEGRKTKKAHCKESPLFFCTEYLQVVTVVRCLSRVRPVPARSSLLTTSTKYYVDFAHSFPRRLGRKRFSTIGGLGRDHLSHTLPIPLPLPSTYDLHTSVACRRRTSLVRGLAFSLRSCSETCPVQAFVGCWCWPAGFSPNWSS